MDGIKLKLLKENFVNFGTWSLEHCYMICYMPVTVGPASPQMLNEAEQYLLASPFAKRLAMHLNGLQPAELMGDSEMVRD